MKKQLTDGNDAPAILPEGYDDFLRDIKERIASAQVQAAFTLSRELVGLYWQIGHEILARQAQHGWGAKVIDRLAADLKKSFPAVEGFSPRNLKYMRAFAESFPDPAIVQKLLHNSPLPWWHYVRIMEKVQNPDERLWYIRAAHEYGWSGSALVHQIETKLFERQGKAVTNFARTLPPPQSDLAQQILKDPYNFDFLTLSDDAHERHLERGLLAHVRQFLLEMGAGFSLVGSQYHLEVSGKDYYLDLLFYHLKLRCFVVVDLKMREFIPEDAGKMNFYLAAVDDLLRHPSDAESVGIILCKTKDRVTIEYALRNTATPIGVSAFTLTDLLPQELQSGFPTVREIERELNGVAEANSAEI